MKKLLTISLAAVMTVALAMPALAADTAPTATPADGNTTVGAPAPGGDTTPAITFTDVKEADYFCEPVLWAVGKKITTGATETTFEPNANCTKAQILTFLYRAAGEPAATITANPFKDVAEADYFYKAALWAAEQKLVEGEEFLPNDPCTRANAVEYIWKQAGSPAAAAAAGFTDVTGDLAKAADWAKEAGVTTGATDTTFEPANICTRAQIATFLYRAFGKEEVKPADADKKDEAKADDNKKADNTGDNKSDSKNDADKKDEGKTDDNKETKTMKVVVAGPVRPIPIAGNVQGPVVGTLTEGAEVTVTGESGDFYCISGFASDPNTIGFVPKSYLE